ncbi:hypothetical protein AM493_02885 [Flavobacterium akiainvivens]|uniref:DUF1572 domain-containing protein n=1 Tax=Flavobacterium akiainvivens TaxID=1202724 RepID=A0A0M8MG70_9FLAO|nr:DUF1572 family protein [Flavobacterium akiainvivens]KOS05097.1 hypothetical protein AM493_02885 [Flavobacterium akiainvivens]SFQ51669.1 Protein of unknown function [Flavobacterium akiainvivens]
METAVAYIESVKKQFLYYKTLGEKAMAQLQPEQLFFSPNEDTNSIAIIVKHLHGNMLSRWTDFLTSDGEKEWRNRDDEFENPFTDAETLMQKWNEGWDCLLNALETVTPDNLDSIIYIRNEGHTVTEAINRQLAHYPYHIGQIVFFAKQLKQEAWNSLSISKNNSAQYNNQKFAEEKGTRNFIDSELNRLNNTTK